MAMLGLCEVRGIYPAALLHATSGCAPYMLFFMFNPFQVWTNQFLRAYFPAKGSLLFDWHGDEEFWYAVGYALIMVGVDRAHTEQHIRQLNDSAPHEGNRQFAPQTCALYR